MEVSQYHLLNMINVKLIYSPNLNLFLNRCGFTVIHFLKFLMQFFIKPLIFLKFSLVDTISPTQITLKEQEVLRIKLGLLVRQALDVIQIIVITNCML